MRRRLCPPLRLLACDRLPDGTLLDADPGERESELCSRRPLFFTLRNQGSMASPLVLPG